jgi:two-component system phosphate regulon response regulator PhoB
MSSVLVVEDEQSLREPLVYILEREGFEVFEAADGPTALVQWKERKPDLILLDLMLPGMSGVDVCREIRNHSSVPIIMVTAKDSEVDKVVGLEIGADDYVTKPFSPKELIARVKALLRRQTPIDDTGPLSIGPLKLDPSSHRVLAIWPNCEPKSISLGPTEYRLLQFFMANPERVHSRANLLDKVWGNEVYIEERTVDVHIKRLRAALTPVDCDRFIETVRGSGYRITKMPTET